MLKYGRCSYFALAYLDKHPTSKILAVLEYDGDLEKDYLVHFLLMDGNGSFIDAEGTFRSWEAAIKDMEDVEFMDLKTKEVDKDFVVQMIQGDEGFDHKLFEEIKEFVNIHYGK